MKKFYSHFLILIILSFFFVSTSCEVSPSVTYPSWFNDYSGTALVNLKSAQDAFNCFGDTISSNLTTYPDDTFYYSEDSSSKSFMGTFTTKDGGALVDSTDIQPFRDGALANGFSASDTTTYNYAKGNITFSIYVIDWNAGDAHFEIMIDEN